MSPLAITQIPKPADEQGFERASVVLWRCLLKDPSVEQIGRRGQSQNGVDLFGRRNCDVNSSVGIQCKLKGPGKTLSEKEVREEVEKAKSFEPPLKEYYITTTAPNDAAMQELARKITEDLDANKIGMRVYIWGWGILEEKICEHADARKAFDPTHTPHSETISTDTKTSLALLNNINTMLNERLPIVPSDVAVGTNILEANLDAEIDGYRNLNNEGKALTAISLLEKLLDRIKETASGRILFRIKANIAHCFLSIDKTEEAAATLLTSYEHAPNEPIAITNKVLGLLLQRKWQEALNFGKQQLEADPTNEARAMHESG